MERPLIPSSAAPTWRRGGNLGGGGVTGMRPAFATALERDAKRAADFRTALVMDPLLRIRECALYAGVSPGHIRRLIHERKLAATRLSPHGAWRVRFSALRELLASMEVK
jgi:excisionase family DNA binding protein